MTESKTPNNPGSLVEPDQLLMARALSGRDAPSVLEKEALFERVMDGVRKADHAQAQAEGREPLSAQHERSKGVVTLMRAAVARWRPGLDVWRWVAGVAVAAMALAWVPVLKHGAERGHGLERTNSVGQLDGFRSRGADDAGDPALVTAVCVRDGAYADAGSSCRLGDLLMFVAASSASAASAGSGADEAASASAAAATKASNQIQQQAYFGAFVQRPDGVVIWYFPNGDHPNGVRFKREESGSGVGAGGNGSGLLGAAVPLESTSHLPGVYTLHGFVSAQPLSRERIQAHVLANQAQDGAAALTGGLRTFQQTFAVVD